MGTTNSYGINGLGQRVTKAGTGYTGTIRFVYADDGKLLGEYDNTGTIVAEHVYLNDTPIAVIKGTGAYLVQADHLNTPRAILGAANALVWKWDSDAFGTTAANENPSALGIFNYNLRFPGQYYDKETANHYNYFRDNYNPKIGRYMQSDPIGLKGGLNTYTYVKGNPVSRIDPLGLWTVNIGISGSINIPLIGPVGIGGGGFGGVVFDGTHWAWYYGGGGGGGGGAGGSLGIQIGGSNAKSVCDLRGPFGSVSASGGEGLIIGGEGYTGSGSNGQTVTGGNFVIGGGGGTPVTGTVGVTYTAVKPW